MSGTPRYVERGGEAVHRPPYACNNTHLFGFVVKGDRAVIQRRIVDPALNIPSGGATDYRVVTGRVLVTFADCRDGRSLVPPDSGMGATPELSCTIWVLTAAVIDGKVDHFAFYVPYIVVDNAWSVCTGREVYGFPKEGGTFEFPERPPGAKEPPDPQQLSASAVCLVRYQKDAIAEPQPLVTVRRTHGLSSALASWGETAEDAAAKLFDFWTGGVAGIVIPGVESVVEGVAGQLLRGKEVPAVFLKQFRDAADGLTACYQAIWEAPTSITRLRKGRPLLGGYEVEVADFDSHPIMQDLGLPSRSVRAELAFFVDFDFETVGPRKVWSADAGDAPRAEERKKKIAVLGGGVGAMTAAFELTEAPGWEDRYEITVYQLGWRLGGKGASGRNPEKHDRVEEHGLHLWFGYYDNAFSLMRRCYAALGRSPDEPLATFDEAFRKRNLIVVENDEAQGWPFVLPTNALEPGDGASRSLLDVLEDLARLPMILANAILPEERKLELLLPNRVVGAVSSALGSVVQSIEARLSARGPDAALASLARALVASAGAPVTRLETLENLVSRRFSHVLDPLRAWMDDLSDPALLTNARRVEDMIELSLVALRGILEERLHETGFDSINDLDFRDWLRKHRASERALDSDALRIAYDSIFAYAGGDTARPDIAAGVALHGLLRLMLDWKGAVMWEMQAGMGDTIFAPLYEVLKKRGVAFKFFHRVTRLTPSEDGTQIRTIHVARQAELKGGPTGYEPLYDVKGLPSWPSHPLWDQMRNPELVQGTDLEDPDGSATEKHFTLKVGEEFDEVVLGISVGGLPPICEEIRAQKKEWGDMLDNVETVATQAFQLWMQPNLRELRFDPRPPHAPVVGGYAQELNCYADMSHLIARESWGIDAEPGSIAYFCGPSRALPGPANPAHVSRIVTQWIDANLGRLWPGAHLANGKFDWSLLFDPARGMADQYCRQNSKGTERYVLSKADTIRYRLRSDQSGYANLVLAGDWTENGLSIGCVESAAISGMQAARKLSGFPKIIPGENGLER